MNNNSLEQINEVISLMKRMGENIDTNNYYLYLENFKPSVIISENLIKSYDIDKVILFISKYFHLDNGTKILTLNQIKNKPENYNGIIYKENCANECNRIVIELNNISIKDKLDYYLKKYGYFNSRIDGNQFYYEKQYDEEIKNFQLQEYTKYLYHVTPKENIYNINKKGIKVKTKTNPNGYMHQDRIYLFLNKPNEDDLRLFPQDSVVLKINITKLPLDLSFYFDVRIPNALYILENIPKEIIEKE